MNVIYEDRNTSHSHRIYLLAMRMNCAMISCNATQLRIECTQVQHERLENVRKGGRDELLDGRELERFEVKL